MAYLLDFALLACIYFWQAHRHSGIKKSALALNTLMYIYLCGVLYFTLMPILVSLPYCLNHPYIPMCMTPFRDAIMGYGDYERQIVLNVIMTVPFGFLLPLCRNISDKSCGFLRCILITILLSLAIELLQPLINASRSSDITDLITNTVGGALGYLLYLPLKRSITRKNA